MNLNKYYKEKGLCLTNRKLSMSFRLVRDYLFGIKTPIRIIEEGFIKDFMPLLEGKVIELGASKNNRYKRFAVSADEYILSNLLKDDPDMMYLDVLNMHLEDNSVDGIVCLNVLEHVIDPGKAIREIKRVLKPGGKIFLTVPFTYYFHPFPDDLYRFSPSVLSESFKDFNIIRCETLGNIWSALATIIQKPRFKGKLRTLDMLVHMLGLIFCLLSRIREYQDEYFMACCLIAEKKHA